MPSTPSSPERGRRPSRTALVALVAISVLVPLGGLVAVLAASSGDGDTDSPGPTSRVAVGAPVPDFEITGLDGQPVRLADFRGRPLVLTFFASWCHPCEEELPVLEDARAEHAGTFEVLAVSYDDLPRDSRAFVERLGVSFPVALDTDDLVARRYGVRGIPLTLFVDAGGVLHDQRFGITSRRALEEPLDALLAAR